MHFFFANSLSFDFNFENATLECMPHRFFTSKLLHEYHSLFYNFRLDFLIGLKIKFDVCHRNVQNYLILLTMRLKHALIITLLNLQNDLMGILAFTLLYYNKCMSLESDSISTCFVYPCRK